jgi:hypothetical protein
MNPNTITTAQFIVGALAFGGGLLFSAWLVLDEVKQGFEDDAKPYDWEREEW